MNLSHLYQKIYKLIQQNNKVNFNITLSNEEHLEKNFEATFDFSKKSLTNVNQLYKSNSSNENLFYASYISSEKIQEKTIISPDGNSKNKQKALEIRLQEGLDGFKEQGYLYERCSSTNKTRILMIRKIDIDQILTINPQKAPNLYIFSEYECLFENYIRMIKPHKKNLIICFNFEKKFTILTIENQTLQTCYCWLYPQKKFIETQIESLKNNIANSTVEIYSQISGQICDHEFIIKPIDNWAEDGLKIICSDLKKITQFNLAPISLAQCSQHPFLMKFFNTIFLFGLIFFGFTTRDFIRAYEQQAHLKFQIQNINFSGPQKTFLTPLNFQNLVKNDENSFLNKVLKDFYDHFCLKNVQAWRIDDLKCTKDDGFYQFEIRIHSDDDLKDLLNEWILKPCIQQSKPTSWEYYENYYILNFSV